MAQNRLLSIHDEKENDYTLTTDPVFKVHVCTCNNLLDIYIYIYI